MSTRRIIHIFKVVLALTVISLFRPTAAQNFNKLHNLVNQKQLNIFNSLDQNHFLTDGLLPEVFKARWMNKSIIPDHVQQFLEVFQQNERNNTFIDELFEGVSNDDCKGHFLELVQRFNPLRGLRWTTPEDQWAAHMMDSWGKFPEGILTGHVSAFGDFDECVKVKARNIDILNRNFPDISRSFEGSYCTSNIMVYFMAWMEAGREPPFDIESAEQQAIANFLSSNMTMSGGIGTKEALPFWEFLFGMLGQKIGMLMLFPSFSSCFPSTCSKTDVQNIYVNVMTRAYRLVNNINENITFLLPAPVVVNCAVEKKPDMDAPAIIMVIILSILIVLCLGAGIVDYWLSHVGQQKPKDGEEKKKPPARGMAYKYLMAFSFYTNTKKFLSTRRSADDLGCLHGIRFFSTAWVLLAHTYTSFVDGPQWNLIDMKNIWQNWTTLAVINATFSVDTFFVMSGMLATYNILKMLDKTKGKFNVPMFYVHRIVRLTPTYAILVGIASTLTIYLGNGPYWYKLEEAEAVCRRNWWTNLLYINNIYRTDEMCNGESWYLSNDFQFYILSPFIVYPIWKFKLVGLALLALYTVLSSVSRVLVVHYKDAPPAMVMTAGGDVMMNTFDIYMRPWTRIQTFFVGVWLGWLLHETKNRRLKLPPWAVAVGWLSSTAVALTVVFAIKAWFDPNYKIPKAAGLFYAGLSRFAFAVSVSWVIFACVKGYGGFVNTFLSWKVFMPLGRLCFCVYLISTHLQLLFHVGLKVPMRYEPYQMVNLYFAHMVSSYLAGVICTLLFECHRSWYCRGLYLRESKLSNA